MPAEALLSDLCGICYTQQPKYRCPGCNAKTCSLPCYKKHQQRASCTGKRNPAAYLKKSQWATPAAIDRDYNYLRSVERAIDQGNSNNTTDDSTSSKTTSPAILKNVMRGRHPDSRLQKYLTQHTITVENAPIGMSRQKTNQTRPTKKNNIVWTIEWIIPDQETKHTEHDCLESTSLASLFASSPLDKQSRGIKRKRDSTEHHTQESQSTDTNEERIPHTTRTENVANEYKFFLLRPNTTSSSKVLIPLDANSTVTEILKGRTVLEFPTIYIFPSSSSELPEGYILEETYLAERRDEEAELEGAISRTPTFDGSGQGKGKGKVEEKEEVDANAILDMLRRDVRR